MLFQPYLNFAGDCREAFETYARIFGGNIEVMQTHGESPMKDQTPPEMQNAILHVHMSVGDQVLMGSDAPPEHFEPAQGIHVSISVDEPAEADRIYNALAEGAKRITMPIGETFWSPRFGMLVDRFGTPWIVNCTPKS